MQWTDPATGKVPEAKLQSLNFERSKISAAQSLVGFYHFKKEDLCLEVAPPKCKTANPIPGPVIGMIYPIMDR